MDKKTNDSPEEGEILDYEHYEPLPRPVASMNNSIRSKPASDSSDSSDNHSDSDDSDDGPSIKKPKMPKRKPVKCKKYNVWAAEFQTSELIDELCNWETKNRVMDKSRDVESYYHFSEETESASEREVRKRRFGEVVDLRTKLGKRQDDNKDPQIHPRYLSELRVSIDDSVEEVTQDITLKLCEEKEDLVLRVVQVLGKEKAIDMFNKTKNFEADGGMMVMNGSRRRTPGGVFLQLIKKDEDITKDQKKNIFIDEKERNLCRKSKGKNLKKSNTRKFEGKNENTEQCLPVLVPRKELALSVAKAENSAETYSVNSALTVDSKVKEDPRQLAVYDDTFDDNPFDIEFT